jgi:hypothetical protein
MSILGRHEVALKRGFQILRGVALTNGMGGSEKEFQWLYMPGILTLPRTKRKMLYPRYH